MDDEYLLNGLKYFKAYQQQRQKELAVKISKERSVLPVKAFEALIVESVRSNRVVLIAADTGVLNV